MNTKNNTYLSKYLCKLQLINIIRQDVYNWMHIYCQNIMIENFQCLQILLGVVNNKLFNWRWVGHGFQKLILQYLIISI